ncbi:MAG: FAD-dependent thymidylate synthase [Peptococcaceae bacterium]|jgi:thymidylate synthase (FAD)|nr:FAD-dependent thymidylate synthase [Peptococcaceae bacterium]
MQVQLIQYTPDPERVVAAAARLCYSADPVPELLERLDEAKTSAFIRNLFALGHLSPFEHVSFQFAIDGVSRSLSHQFVRHRLASYSQRSQRYVKELGFDYVIPPKIAANLEAKERFERVMAELQEHYAALLALAPAEDARYLLPNACTTSLVATLNARSLFNFFALRLCMRAQWEIRALAEEMLRLVQSIAPNIFARSGPACVTQGICREGKLGCGRLNRIKESNAGNNHGT